MAIHMLIMYGLIAAIVVTEIPFLVTLIFLNCGVYCCNHIFGHLRGEPNVFFSDEMTPNQEHIDKINAEIEKGVTVKFIVNKDLYALIGPVEVWQQDGSATFTEEFKYNTIVNKSSPPEILNQIDLFRLIRL